MTFGNLSSYEIVVVIGNTRKHALVSNLTLRLSVIINHLILDHYNLINQLLVVNPKNDFLQKLLIDSVIEDWNSNQLVKSFFTILTH